MKVRQGHVSNSSSTSFLLIISADDFDLLHREAKDEYDDSALSLLADPSPCGSFYVDGGRAFVFKNKRYLGDPSIKYLQTMLASKLEGRYFLEINDEDGQ